MSNYSQNLSRLIQDMGEIQRDGRADPHIVKLATALEYVARCESDDDTKIRALTRQVESLSQQVEELKRGLIVTVR